MLLLSLLLLLVLLLLMLPSVHTDADSVPEAFYWVAGDSVAL